MVFASYEFLFKFLPTAIILYFIIGKLYCIKYSIFPQIVASSIVLPNKMLQKFSINDNCRCNY